MFSKRWAGGGTKPNMNSPSYRRMPVSSNIRTAHRADSIQLDAGSITE